jgi:hypothetical protein
VDNLVKELDVANHFLLRSVVIYIELLHQADIMTPQRDSPMSRKDQRGNDYCEKYEHEPNHGAFVSQEIASVASRRLQA